MLVITSKRRHCFLPRNIWSTQSYHPHLRSLRHQRGLPAILSSCGSKFAKCHPRGKPHKKTTRNSTRPNIDSVLWGHSATQRLCSEFLSWCPHFPDGSMCFRVSGLKKMNSFSMLSSCLQILPPSREFASL